MLSERGGYLDVELAAALPPGWATARLSVDGSKWWDAPLRIVDKAARLGVVSDIDDTVVITALPRPLLAFWNTFVRRDHSRMPVPGMAQLYGALLAQDPYAPIFYLSTGAWNTAPALTRFLERHGYPAGPLLMTDWGPTADGWFRSGQAHKRTELSRLLAELPALAWVLVGDDGQHDPDLYTAAAAGAPGRVRLVAIRQLTATQQVLTHGTPEPPRERLRSAAAPEVRAPDGFGLLGSCCAPEACCRDRDSPRVPGVTSDRVIVIGAGPAGLAARGRPGAAGRALHPAGAGILGGCRLAGSLRQPSAAHGALAVRPARCAHPASLRALGSRATTSSPTCTTTHSRTTCSPSSASR